MLPNNNLLTPIPKVSQPNYSSADHFGWSKVINYYQGPISLTSIIGGVVVQQWVCRTYPNKVTVQASNMATEHVIATGVDITEATAAVNSNGYIHAAWVDQGITKFRWFNTAINDSVVTTLSNNEKCPKMILDDPRQEISASADVILFYIKQNQLNNADNGLYFRYQRDRFVSETQINNCNWLSLEKVYLTKFGRLAFALVPYFSNNNFPNTPINNTSLQLPV